MHEVLKDSDVDPEPTKMIATSIVLAVCSGLLLAPLVIVTVIVFRLIRFTDLALLLMLIFLNLTMLCKHAHL